MDKYAIIESGVVVNIIIADADFAESVGAVHAGTAGIGWSYANGTFSAPPSPLPTLADYDKALTDHLDAVAQARRWENRITLMSRAGFSGPWQAEAIAFGQWADGCNVIGYTILDQFQAGEIPQPTIAEVLAALPVMVWPD